MNARLGLILSIVALMTASGCAAGSGGSGGGPAAGPVPNIPAGGTVLEEGIRPRDNEFTREADNILDQALNAEEGPERDALFQQALSLAQQGIAADSMNPKSYYQAALANMHLGEYRTADEMFDRAEELHPRYILETEGWRERGWVDAYNDAIVPLNAGDLEPAADLMEAANQLYDQRYEAFLQLGSVYARMGQYDESVEAYRGAMALLEESEETAMMDTTRADTWQEHYGMARSGLAQSLQFGEQYQAAADLYGEMLQDDPENAQLIGSLASVLTELEMPDSVDALYNNLLNRPGLTEADFANAGVGLFRIGEYDRAAQAFRSAADMNPFNRDARLNLVQTYFTAENWEAVLEPAQETLEVDPLNGFVWVILARAYSELEQPEEANRIFNEYQAIGYEIEDLMLEPLPRGGARVSGSLKNNEAEEGGTVTLRFHFGNREGEEVGTTDIRIQLPAVEQSVEFSGTFNSSESVTGYLYEVVE